jgi:hypothetical protein
MGFLSSLFGGKPAQRGVHEGHPQLAPVIAALEKWDPRPAQALFESAPPRWDLRTVVVELVANRYFMKFEDGSRQAMIDGCLSHPPQTMWQMARGAWHVVEGWKVRGSGQAASVNDEAWKVLDRRCRAALDDLRTAARSDPADPTSHTLTMTVARGLSDRALGETAYREAIARDPLGYEPHARYLTLVSPRWFGSHDEMASTARQIAERAPDGSDLAGLPILAHYDRYSHTCVFDKNPVGAGEQLRHAHGEVVAACERSIDAPAYQPSHATARLRHRAAVMFYELGDLERCKQQLAKVGDVFDEDPWWQNAPDPARRYAAVRKQLGLS